jgi:RNA polymerase sigma-32 factor
MNKKYQNYVMSLKTLDADQERELILEYKRSGSQKAKNTLVDHFMKLIIKMAKEVKVKNASNDPENGLDDLINDGVIGFLIALDKFDVTKISNNMTPNAPIRISTYAKWWVRVFIHGNALNRKSKIYKLGSGKMKGVYFTVPRLMSENGWESPLKYEHAITIANHIGHGVTPDEVIAMERLKSTGDISLDSTFAYKGDSGISMVDTISSSDLNPEEQMEIKQMKGYLYQAINIECKDDRERDVLLNKTFADTPVTLESLSEKYNISKQRLLQIEKDGTQKIFTCIKTKLSRRQG